MTTMVPITDLTQSTLEGQGVFDVLMRATKIHLESEYAKNRIKGAEYATVYLGSLESVMRTSLDFLIQRQRIALEAELMAQQVLVAQAEVQKMNAEVDLVREKVLIAKVELEIATLNKAKIPAEIAHLEAQTALIDQQKAHAILKSPIELAHLQNQTDLIGHQEDNAVLEGTVLVAQECKLRAEYDLLLTTNLKAQSENSLLLQKVATEKAQTTAYGVDTDSVIGKQKNLYQAQTDGFSRDAEQKAAKLMVDSWNVRRTTDEGTVADGTNMLADTVVGRAVTKMLNGVGA